MKADSSAPTLASAARVVSSPALRGIRCSTNAATAPVFSSAALITSTPATVITAGWPKPANAEALGTRPSSVVASSAAGATRSWRKRPQMNKPIVTISTARIFHLSGVMR